MMLGTIVVVAKQPRPGRVKTRLIGRCTPTEAAAVAAASLRDTLAALSDVASHDRVLLFDGDATDWVPEGWRVVPQVAGGLDERLAHGFDALDDAPALLVGMDTPQLSAGDLDVDLVNHDVCIGLAFDGGYWAIGFREPRRAAEVIRGVPMSTSFTGRAQLRRLNQAGMSIQMLPKLTDIDTASDAEHVASTFPHTRFAIAWRSIAGPAAGTALGAAVMP